MYKNLKELIRHDEDTFMAVDELILFLTILSKGEDGVEKEAFILNWLRSLRQVSKTKVRWLFCGSVGLRNFTSAMNLGYTVNDLTEFSLDELSHDEAAGLLLELCKSENIEMNDELVEYTLNKLYWNIPYFIQIIFSNLAEDYADKITREDMLNNLMTGQDASKIESVDYTLSKVLAMLENDGYIMKKDGVSGYFAHRC